jgi:hypothetical protein
MFYKIIEPYGLKEWKSAKVEEKFSGIAEFFACARKKILDNSPDKLMYTNALRQISNHLYRRHYSRFVVRGDNPESILRKISQPNNTYGCLDLDAAVEKPDDITSILELLAHPNSNIFEVILSRNGARATHLAQYFSRIAQSNTPVIAADVSNNEIGPEGPAVSGWAMKQPWWKIEEYNISSTLFEDEAYFSLIKSAPDTLYYLASKGNYLNDDGVLDEVVHGAINDTNIVHLEVSTCSGHENIEALLRWEMAKPQRQIYQFYGFELSAELAEIFAHRRMTSSVVLFHELGDACSYHQATQGSLAHLFI